MPGVLMVEWLGRGGFAHTAESWLAELTGAGHEVVLVTRGGRELADAVPGSAAVGDGAGPLRAHRAVLREALSLLADLRPDTLILHGSVLPQLELPLVAAARRRGTTSVLVAHEPATGRRTPGSSTSLRRMVSLSDIVVVHSRFVISELERRICRRDYRLIPLPLPLGLVSARGEPLAQGAPALVRSGQLLALHFGHLHRAYKGTAVVMQLAEAGAPGWQFALVGKGAPTGLSSALVVDRFLDRRELVATVAAADAVLLPYDRASQSAAVVLAQALGAVVIGSAVGGIPEQVIDGKTGFLVPPNAAVTEWVDRLALLEDEAARAEMATAARLAVVASHEEFAAAITALVR